MNVVKDGDGGDSNSGDVDDGLNGIRVNQQSVLTERQKPRVSNEEMVSYDPLGVIPLSNRAKTSASEALNGSQVIPSSIQPEGQTTKDRTDEMVTDDLTDAFFSRIKRKFFVKMNDNMMLREVSPIPEMFPETSCSSHPSPRRRRFKVCQCITPDVIGSEVERLAVMFYEATVGML
ncbi:hypothetical protein Bca52824_036730 [Brassica carinata]|uniref:Uncharacterized protein n=1 Tax=Brassica carinata TaxID=52824 RepID=A0A8X7S6J7_BRACI|nr:hypothetical protein Bca52824_036730 [Brassica carinata]